MANYGPFAPAQIDFSPLLQIGEDIGGALSSNRTKQMAAKAIADATMPDGTIDWGKVTTNLIQAGDYKGAAISSQQAESEAMARHRADSLKPEAQRLYEWAYPGDAVSQATPPANMSPGPSVSRSPAEFLQSRTRTSDPYTVTKAKKQAEYDAYRATKLSQAPNLKAGLRELSEIAEGIDDASFANALGPLQGAEASDIVSGYALQIPRLGGEIMNKWEGGKTPPTEVRNMITGGAQALSAAIKPLVRAPGEGIWTDRDQELLDRIVGNLAESRTKAEFKRRLQGVANRVQKNFGIDLSGWDAKPGSDAANDVGAPNPWASTSQSDAVAYGSPGLPTDEGPYRETGPVPSEDHLQLLRQHANNPEFRADWEAYYGAGSVDRWLGNEGWTGR